MSLELRKKYFNTEADQICLLGSAPSSLRLAPFGNKDWAMIGCSPGVYGVAPRTEAWVELHRYEPGQPWFSPEYCQFLANYPGPVWMAEKRPEIPNSIELPLVQLIQKYSPYFFTSSLSYMMAMAIECEFKRIGLYGVDMAAACVSHDTKVLMKDLRWVRADSLEVGDQIMAFDEHAQQYGKGVKQRRWQVATVQRNDRLTMPCYKLTLEDGRELISSEDHLWLTYGENQARWMYTKDLVGVHHRADRPSRIIDCIDTWDEDTSWGAGYLAAAFDGEGHVSAKLRDGQWGYMRVGFAQRDNAMLETVRRELLKRNFLAPTSSVNGTHKDVHNLLVHGGRAEQMKFLGSIRPRRLLDKFDPTQLGIFQKRKAVAVVKSEYLGDYPVIGLKTDTSTFIAEGLASHNSEYKDQRLGCQYFAIIAKAHGIEVGVPPESDLFRPSPLYGISETSHARIKVMARRRELEGRVNAALQAQQNAKDETLYLRGALEDLEWAEMDWMGNVDGPSNCFLEPPMVAAMQQYQFNMTEVSDDESGRDTGPSDESV